MTSREGRLLRAAGATALAFVVLSGAGGSGATWAEHAERDPGTIHSGGVSVTTGSSRVELHSRQPSGSRTYASTTSCTPDDGYTECRVITDTIADEALIPGDRVIVTEGVRVAASGTNLTGTFTVEAGPLTSAAVSAFSGSATTTTTVTPPAGSGRSGQRTSFDVSTASGEGIGSYSVRSVITTPPGNGGARWGTALTGQQLYDGNLTYTFTQS